MPDEIQEIKVVILANEDPQEHQLWIKACENRSEKSFWRVVELTNDNWFEQIHTEPFDLLLAKPGGLSTRFKTLYDERIRILSVDMGYLVFPSYEEILIYENKRYLAAWLKAHGIPHPETHVFYAREEAESWCSAAGFPLVAKTNIGASGSGVVILRNMHSALAYIKKSFSRKGSPQRWGPDLSKGRLIRRVWNAFGNTAYLKRKINIYRAKRQEKQIGFVIFQEFIPHEYEWRVVRMGDSFFAHKKLKLGEKTSGSLLKGYGSLPPDLLDFVKGITDKHKFYSQSIDIFESERGYLVNEMQCFFGQSDPHQMIINGVSGRYVYSDSGWVFEAGSFNTNESYDLRLAAALDILKKNSTQ